MSDESRRAAGILAQCKWLRDQIAQWERQAKEVIAGELEGGERTKAVAADGTVIGAVTRAEGARTMQIDNEEGFLMWVKHRYPHEVVETVRPAFVKLCAEKVKVLGHLPDANGELCPHVSLVRNEPSISAKLSDQDKLVIEDLFRQRHMPEVMAAMETLELPVAQGDSAVAGHAHLIEEWNREIPNGPVYMAGDDGVYDGPMDDTAQAYLDIASETDGTVDPEPFIEEGPPDWPESNTFETSDAVHQRRRD